MPARVSTAQDRTGGVTPPGPVAERRPTKREHHGHVFIDDYEWLREKTDPDVVAHLQAENAHTDVITASLTELTDTIYGEITARTLETDLSVPVRRGKFWYFTRSAEGQSYGVHCRVPVTDSGTPAVTDELPPHIDPVNRLDGEQVLLDSNVEAAGHDFFSLGAFSISTDGTRLVYSIDTEGDERYTVHVKNLDTGEVSVTDVIAETASGAMLDVTGEFIFYCTVDDSWRPDTVWRHRIGTPASDDHLVFTEPDDRFWVGVGSTRSRKYLTIGVGSKVTSEILLLDAANPTGEFEVVWPRVEGVEYDVEHVFVSGEDRLLITHNVAASNFETVDVAASHPRGERRTVIAHRADARLEGVDAFSTHVIVSYRRNGLAQIGVMPLHPDGYGALTEIEFDEPLYDAGLGANPEWNAGALRLSFRSMVTPATVLSIAVAPDAAGVAQLGERHILKTQPVLGGYHPSDYEQRRVWATAADGTRIPVSVVFNRTVVTEQGPAPTLLYGYGSYEASIDPNFSIPRLSLLDRGMVFAIAHVRGGGELGRHWYDSGKMLHKKNSFSDFVAVARHLIETGVTTPQQLVAEGASAGGLLMGAVANLAPELFAGILAGVPFVDALTSILDPDLPLTVIEWDEWGDPLHDAEVYEYMRSYTPYENVRADVSYPHILATTSLNDTRVLYVEPAKWVAKLREVGAPALLKTEMSAGHGGVSGRYEAWRERAFELAWILSTAGVAGGGTGAPQRSAPPA